MSQPNSPEAAPPSPPLSPPPPMSPTYSQLQAGSLPSLPSLPPEPVEDEYDAPPPLPDLPPDNDMDQKRDAEEGSSSSGNRSQTSKAPSYDSLPLSIAKQAWELWMNGQVQDAKKLLEHEIAQTKDRARSDPFCALGGMSYRYEYHQYEMELFRLVVLEEGVDCFIQLKAKLEALRNTVATCIRDMEKGDAGVTSVLSRLQGSKDATVVSTAPLPFSAAFLNLYLLDLRILTGVIGLLHAVCLARENEIVEAALKIRSAHNILEEIESDVQKKIKKGGPAQQQEYKDILAELDFYMGALRYFLSLVPGGIYQYFLSILGFSSDRQLGLKQLRRCASFQAGGTRTPIARFVIYLALTLKQAKSNGARAKARADKFLQQTLKAYPKGIFFLFHGGLVALKEGELDVALDRFERAVQWSSEIKPLLNLCKYEIGFIYFRLNQYKQAINYLEEFLNMHEQPSFRTIAAYYLSLSYLLLAREEEEAAKASGNNVNVNVNVNHNQTRKSLQRLILGDWCRDWIPLDVYALRKAKQYISRYYNKKATIPPVEQHLILAENYVRAFQYEQAEKYLLVVKNLLSADSWSPALAEFSGMKMSETDDDSSKTNGGKSSINQRCVFSPYYVDWLVTYYYLRGLLLAGKARELRQKAHYPAQYNITSSSSSSAAAPSSPSSPSSTHSRACLYSPLDEEIDEIYQALLLQARDFEIEAVESFLLILTWESFIPSEKHYPNKARLELSKLAFTNLQRWNRRLLRHSTLAKAKKALLQLGMTDRQTVQQLAKLQAEKLADDVLRLEQNSEDETEDEDEDAVERNDVLYDYIPTASTTPLTSLTGSSGSQSGPDTSNDVLPPLPPTELDFSLDLDDDKKEEASEHKPDEGTSATNAANAEVASNAANAASPTSPTGDAHHSQPRDGASASHSHGHGRPCVLPSAPASSTSGGGGVGGFFSSSSSPSNDPLRSVPELLYILPIYPYTTKERASAGVPPNLNKKMKAVWEWSHSMLDFIVKKEEITTDKNVLTTLENNEKASSNSSASTAATATTASASSSISSSTSTASNSSSSSNNNSSKDSSKRYDFDTLIQAEADLLQKELEEWKKKYESNTINLGFISI